MIITFMKEVNLAHVCLFSIHHRYFIFPFKITKNKNIDFQKTHDYFGSFNPLTAKGQFNRPQYFQSANSNKYFLANVKTKF